jgi:putative endonuclease
MNWLARIPWPWRKRRAAALPEHLQTGRWGEAQAQRHLRQAGYRILGTRVRVGKKDELDIVARREDILVFVEVKTRESEDYGRPRESVRRKKQYVQSRAAMRYMNKLRERPSYFRFDVVEVIGGPDLPNPQIRHIENAFPLARPFRVRW